MDLWTCTFDVNPEEADRLSEAFEDWALATSWEEVKENPSGPWRFEALFREKPTEEDVISRLKPPGFTPKNLAIRIMKEENWLELSYKSFPPMTIGRFYIYGSHNTDPIPTGLHPLHIDAATAFGSGHHETTEGCLRALDELQKTYAFKKPLDMGCGSGILAMATASLWQVPVLACDNDPEAVRVTRENATINDLAPFVTAEESDGYASPVVKHQAPYDLIVSNILAGPLCEMAPDAVESLEIDGVVVLSGILTTQAEQVIAAYRLQGCTLVEQKKIGDWSTLILRKSA